MKENEKKKVLHNRLRVFLLKINEMISFSTRVFFYLYKSNKLYIKSFNLHYILLLYRAALMLLPGPKVHTQKST